MKQCLLLLSTLTWAALALSTQAQTTGVSSGAAKSSGPSEALVAKLLEGQSPFKAKLRLQFQVTGSVDFDHEFAFLDGKTWRQCVGGTVIAVLPTGQNSTYKMGRGDVDWMVSIYRPDKQAVFEAVAKERAYVEESQSQNFEITRTESGTETIDGHACVKYTTVATEKSGQKHNLIQWCAKDLKDFPLRLQLEEGGKTYVFSFHDLEFKSPESSLFEIPANFTKYSDRDQLMKAMSPSTPKAPRKKR